MKSKSEVSKFCQYHKELKKQQSGKKIKVMRFDGSSEYKFIKFDGIFQQVSAPYTQHQNGLAERLNRSLITMASCMLSQAGLPPLFWDAAITHQQVIYEINGLYVKKLDPTRINNVISPKYSHLRDWGCLCYDLIDVKGP